MWMLHDIGKPSTYDHSGVRPSFKMDTLISHEEIGAMEIYRIHNDLIESENKLPYHLYQRLLNGVSNHNPFVQGKPKFEFSSEENIVTHLDALDTIGVDHLKL